jgi:2-polyprenyl-3-methyl-5-hydroxy-6-metoxy-1,4-benzoquinol methylase
MKYKQQDQTKFFFELDAKNWSKKSDINKNLILNTIQERNYYVLKQVKLLKLKSIIDIGCGTGNLSYEASKITKKSLGIDFAHNMIKIAKKKFRNKNLNFLNEDIFNYKNIDKFDCISANGLIEYLSINDIKKFFSISNKLLNKNGYIVFGTRNRLFNLYSQNNFSKNELNKKTFNKFYEEAILLNNLTLDKFKYLKKNKFEEVPFKQPKTGINVDRRHQFSPLQIIDILKKLNFVVTDLYPVNYHPVPPAIYAKKVNFKLFSNFIYKLDNKNMLPYIPFSSSFMVTAKKIK